MRTVPVLMVRIVSPQAIWSPTGENSSTVGGSAAALPANTVAPTTQAADASHRRSFIGVPPFGSPQLAAILPELEGISIRIETVSDA
ncbi:MAG TPA: hypothetical protein VHF67_08100 [Gaiellaceae bacterium]|nr:hypothetical protein [Gaiellaceae bacterium]